MALIDEHQKLAQKIVDSLQGCGDTEIQVEHNDEWTQVYIDGALFDFDENGKQESITIGL
ncbi:MAG: hypothetical protein COA78_21305 [Blastopirellula sp.]|nr:MAG: hypothetical protein COA78_21305 [Blastopirellula sp.]